MTTENAKEAAKKLVKDKLDLHKVELSKHKAELEGLGELFSDDDNRLLGPNNDIQYQKMKKDIEESGNE